MKKRNKTAIILGATGLVGGILLDLLLVDDRYQKIILFSRSSAKKNHPKIKEHLCDLLELEKQKGLFKADEVFCCIGSTNAKTPNKDMYKHIDFGIPVTAAKLCQQNDIPTFIVVSALGADANSSIFYNRIKGQMENKVLEFNITKTHLLQPSMIGGDREEKRPREYLFKKLMQGLDFLFVGSLKKYRVIHPKSIAGAMLWLANHQYKEKRIVSEELKKLSKRG